MKKEIKTKWNKKLLNIGLVLAVIWFINVFSIFSLETVLNSVRLGYLYVGWTVWGMIIFLSTPDF